ncbi:MAG: NAD(P)-binding domain-containing protein [Acidimicrobiia bacterium]|nr:MAG: NAD(P)-binding domain-containing protein [Acidimicrobiia bacterium]
MTVIDQLPVCVIGAGVSGLTTIKHLLDRGIAFDCFEMGSDIGGNWRYDNDSGRSPAYASLHIETSKDRFAYADLKVPKNRPTYLHHTQVLEYLETYTEVFGLRERIDFRHRVVDARPESGIWIVKTEDLATGHESTKSYRAVIVASGHHWDPNLPEQEGSFSGQTMHAQTYRTPDRFIGKDVVVVGIGNTGADIASELSWHASSVTLSTRSGAHVLPRFVFGRPLDSFSTRLSSQLPVGVQRAAYKTLLYVARGSQESYGFPTPETPILSQHPTVSADLLALVKDGQISVRRGISRFVDDEVIFTDGERTRADVVIYATGYRISFPFLDKEVFASDDNKVDLYRQVVPVDVPGLFFVGLIQPVGALPPLAEQQARWVAQLLDGSPLPSSGEMRADIITDAYERSERYQDRPRHTIQVDYWPYLDSMRAICDANEASSPESR